MKKNLFRLILCASLSAAAIVGASMLCYADTDDTADTEEARGERPEHDGGTGAKVVSVSGSKLTVYLEERNEPPADGTAPEDGTAPADGETPPEKPEGDDGTTPPEKPEGEADSTDGGTPPEGGEGHGGMMNASYADETTTLTVSSSATITKGMEKTSVSLSSLEEGDIIRLVFDEDDSTEVVSIEVMDMVPPEDAGTDDDD